MKCVFIWKNATEQWFCFLTYVISPCGEIVDRKLHIGDRAALGFQCLIQGHLDVARRNQGCWKECTVQLRQLKVCL